MSEAHGSYYYPQAAAILKFRLEDFGDKGSGISEKSFELRVLCRKVVVNINDYRTADTFEIEVDYRNFPFDPRSLRSCAVTIAMEDMGKVFTDTNSLNPIEFKAKQEFPDDHNLVFVGFADEESISFDDQKRTVRMEGRDFTSVLIDRKYLEGTISVEKPVDEVIREMLSKLEETKLQGPSGLKIEVRGITGTLPVLSSFYSDKSELAGRKNVKKDSSYWDLIQSMIADAGLICYVELDTLVITKPQILYDRKQAKKFIYGKNIKSLEFRRKIGRKKGFNVVVRCLNVESKEVIEAKIPLEATQTWSDSTGIALGEVKIQKVNPAFASAETQTGQAQQAEDPTKAEPAPYYAFNVANIVNKDQLIAVGESIYEEMSRQQIEGEFSTREMKIRYKSRSDGVYRIFNVLHLRVGNAVYIEIDPSDLREVDTRKVDDVAKFLQGKGYDYPVARTLSQSLNKADTPFYVKAVTFTIDAEQGFDVKIEFLNFIVTDNPAFKGVS